MTAASLQSMISAMEIAERHAQNQMELEAELRRAEAYVEFLQKQVEAGKIFAKTLEQIEPLRAERFPRQSSGGSGTQSLRARNIGDTVYNALRKHNAGSTPMELYDEITNTGVHIGSSEYLYSVIKRLVRKDWIRKDGNRLVANDPPQGTPANAIVSTRYARNAHRSSYTTGG